MAYQPRRVIKTGGLAVLCGYPEGVIQLYPGLHAGACTPYTNAAQASWTYEPVQGICAARNSFPQRKRTAPRIINTSARIHPKTRLDLPLLLRVKMWTQITPTTMKIGCQML